MADDALNQALAGRYRVDREIGRGATAIVYLAHDLRHDRSVALKVLNPEMAASVGTERFLREIALTARLDHSHILPLLDSGEAAGKLFYVMPYVEGESLRERLKRERQLSIPEALQIAREVADALSFAHSRGIVHRDIKPENILLGAGHARVADFGIARAMNVARSEALTVPGMAVGTPAYMSPEQASGEREIDARSDVYSLGCVLYEMLAGQLPYTGATTAAMLSRKLVEPVPSIRVVRENVPQWLEQTITKALAKVPADRFATAAEFAAALRDDQPRTIRSASARRSRRLQVALGGAAAIVTLFTVAQLTGVRESLTSPPSDAQKIQSIAVLPLEDHSPGADQEYLAAGLHEALIIDLGKLSGLLRVSARSSVLRYRKTDKPPRQIAQELGVDALIAGSVTRSGNRVRVTANLIRATTEEGMFSREYTRELQDVLALQDEIVRQIADEVKLNLSSSERASLTSARQVNPEAYDAYLKGKFQLNAFTPEGFTKGMELLRQSVELDPSEPLAYAGLAEGFVLMELVRPASSAEDIARAKAAALKALELDSTLAEVHSALGFVKGAKEWDYAGSEVSMRRAIALNPNLAAAHINFAQHLSIFSTPDSAIAEWKRGIELDPLSPLYSAWYAGALWEFGRPDEAINQAQRAMELQPDFPVALFVLGLAHADKRDFVKAIAAHEKAVTLYPGQGFTWALARTYALAGQQTKARALLAKLKTATPGDAVHPWFIAAAYAALGDTNEALNWLERGYDSRILFLSNLKRDRAAGFDLRPLHGNARYRDLLRRVNLS